MRHGYRVEVPTGWRVTEYPGTWSSLEQFGVGAEVPGEVVVAAPDLSSFLVTNSMQLPEGLAPATWLDAFNTLVVAAIPTDCPGVPTTGRIAGVPATMIRQECGENLILGSALTHDDRGYYFTVVAPIMDADALNTVERVLESIEFTVPPE